MEMSEGDVGDVGSVKEEKLGCSRNGGLGLGKEGRRRVVTLLMQGLIIGTAADRDPRQHKLASRTQSPRKRQTYEYEC